MLQKFALLRLFGLFQLLGAEFGFEGFDFHAERAG